MIHLNQYDSLKNYFIKIYSSLKDKKCNAMSKLNIWKRLFQLEYMSEILKGLFHIINHR